MTYNRSTAGQNEGSGVDSRSESFRTNRLVEALARTVLDVRSLGGDVEPTLGQIRAAVRLCLRILTSKIGDPLVLGDEASIAQSIRTRLVKMPRPRGGEGVYEALRFEDLHRRLRQLGGIHNRAAALHLLCSLAGSGGTGGGGESSEGRASAPVFAEPVGGLSGIERIQRLRPAVRGGRGEGGEDGEDRSVGVEHEEGGGETKPQGVGSKHGRGAWAPREVTEMALLRDVLYSFQGIDSEHIRYNEEAGGYELGSGLQVDPATAGLVCSLVEMGWLFTQVVRHINAIEGGAASMMMGKGAGPGRVKEAFAHALQKEMTEYYRLIAVLEAQLNLDRETARSVAAAGGGGWAGRGGTAGLTLQRLAVWVMDPMERLKHMATLAQVASHLKGGALASCLHTHMQHGDPFVRAQVHRVMVGVCAPLFEMIRHWVFEGELKDDHNEFFVSVNPDAKPDLWWQDRYELNLSVMPKFVDEGSARKILTIGKSINFLRTTCNDSEWIMGPMAKAASEGKNVEYGDALGLRAVVDRCSELTNARLVHLLMDTYKLRMHLRALKKFLLHGQGDVMIALVETLGPELSKKGSVVFRHNLQSMLEGVLKSSNVHFEDPDIIFRVQVKLFPLAHGDTGWQIFSLDYVLGPPLNTVLTEQAMNMYRRVFARLWFIKRIEWMLASAWRLHTSATHVRVEEALPGLRGALHRCSLVRGQMVFLISNLSNYMMFEVLETSWGTLHERLDTAQDLDEIIDAHQGYLNDILGRALLTEEHEDVSTLLDQALSTMVEFCSLQEGLIIRALAEVTTRRAEAEEVEHQTSRGQWGTHIGGRGRRGWMGDSFGVAKIEETAQQYQTLLFELVSVLEHKSAKTEILRFLTFRLDFNE
ncbi:unnamed protein product [Discosporangium mesarthrocarpum]